MPSRTDAWEREAALKLAVPQQPCSFRALVLLGGVRSRVCKSVRTNLCQVFSRMHKEKKTCLRLIHVALGFGMGVGSLAHWLGYSKGVVEGAAPHAQVPFTGFTEGLSDTLLMERVRLGWLWLGRRRRSKKRAKWLGFGWALLWRYVAGLADAAPFSLQLWVSG